MYDSNFKKQTIREYINSDKTMVAVAKEKGIPRETVDVWFKKYSEEIYEENKNAKQEHPTWHNIDGVNGYYA